MPKQTKRKTSKVDITIPDSEQERFEQINEKIKHVANQEQRKDWWQQTDWRLNGLSPYDALKDKNLFIKLKRLVNAAQPR